MSPLKKNSTEASPTDEQGATVNKPLPALHLFPGRLLCGKPPQKLAFSVRNLLTMILYNDLSLWKRHKEKPLLLY